MIELIGGIFTCVALLFVTLFYPFVFLIPGLSNLIIGTAFWGFISGCVIFPVMYLSVDVFSYKKFITTTIIAGIILTFVC
jgi:hypothetical protein